MVAEWRESNGQRYLYLGCSDYYNLGVLKAQHLAKQYITFDYVLKGMIQNLNIPIEYCYELANAYNQYIPKRYQRETQGIADTIPNLSYEDILFAEALFDGFYGQIIPSMIGVNIPPLHVGGCTVIASKNGDNSISIGQTMDLSYFFKDTINFVLYKVKNRNPTFAMNIGACHLIGTTKKITSVLNLIETVVTGEICMPTSIKRRIALETSKNAFEYQQIMINNGFGSSWNWLIGDKYNNLIACESIPAVYDEEVINDGEFVVKSNTYHTEEYIPYLINPSYSIERQAKAEELTSIAMNDGIITLEELFGDILSFRDGTDASITRMPGDDPNNPLMTCTLAFFGKKGKDGIFGIGNPLESNWGEIPI